MAGPRYVVLGLAPVRAPWFGTVAQWANASSLPLEFVKCVSAEELRARLSGGRPLSAVMVDANLPTLDRDLLDAGRQAGCAVVVVEERRPRRDWGALGAHAVLAGELEPAALLDVLRAHATMVSSAELADPAGTAELAGAAGPARGGNGTRPAGTVVALCGSGGTGSSTLAMALAQGLAAHGAAGHVGGHGLAGSGRPPVLLADLARRADLAVLHDARDIVPGVQELVEAHRNRHLTPEEVTSLTFDVAERGYHLLLGLRQASAWASLRPRAFEAAFASLGRAYGTVVCDVEADFEGERDGGSLDVEERNLMARTAVARADVVLAVGMGGVKGLHALVRVAGELATAGVPGPRVVPVVNRSPRGRRPRAELARAWGQLVEAGGGGSRAGGVADRGSGGSGAGRRAGGSSPAGGGDGGGSPASPIFLPERRLDELGGHAARLPSALVDPLVAAVAAVLDRCGPRSAVAPGPRAVVPGSLGHWPDEEAALD